MFTFVRAAILMLCLPLGAVAQENAEIGPPPEGMTAIDVLAMVIRAEQAEASSGPLYLIIREGIEGMGAGLPAISVYKRLDGLGYWHMPPDFVKVELAGADDPSASLNARMGTVNFFETTAVTLYAAGLAAVEEAHGRDGAPFLTLGALFADGLKAHNEDLRKEALTADDMAQARTAAMRRFAEAAVLVGEGRAWGEEIYYLLGSDLGIRVPLNGLETGLANSDDYVGEGSPVRGHMIVDQLELWVGRDHHRIVAMRMRAHGASDAMLTAKNVIGEDMTNYDVFDAAERYAFPLGRIEVWQTREAYRAVGNTSVRVPGRKVSMFSLEGLGEAIRDTEAMAAIQQMARDREEALTQLRARGAQRAQESGSSEQYVFSLEEKAIWDQINSRYETSMIQLEPVLRMAAEGFDVGSVTNVECALSAQNASQLVAALTVASAVHETASQCGAP